MVPAASGDGFAPSQAALDAAAEAADTLWWWWPDDSQSPPRGEDASGGGRGGAWRTRTETVEPGAGVKIAIAKDNDDEAGGGEKMNGDAAPWVPWSSLLDATEAPYFRWFEGARTNACFNAVDRHLLDGRGDDVALTCLPEDLFKDGGRYSVTRRQLAGAVAVAAAQLRDVHKLRPRDRVLFHMPTDAVHFAYMLACQRLGVAYSATAVDSVEDVLASRAQDLEPKLVVCMDAPVTHGGVDIDCAAKLRRAVPDVPVLLAKPWHSPAVQKDAATFAAMSDEKAFIAITQLCAPLPCASDHPLFVSYTSGSTGRPKGVVHGHGGYVAGVLATMVREEDKREIVDELEKALWFFCFFCIFNSTARVACV